MRAAEPPLLRRQLLAWLLAPLFALLVVDTFISYWVAVRFAERAYDRALGEIAREISLHLKPAGEGVRLDLHDDAREILLSDPVDRIFFEVTAAAGAPLAGQRLAPPPQAAPSGRETFYDGEVQGVAVRLVQISVDDARWIDRAGGVVRVAETMEKRDRLVREIMVSVVAPQAVLILVALTLVSIGVLRGLAPLERLRRTVLSRSPRDSTPIAADDLPGELRPLLQAINELVARLDAALALQNRFISDAAHQLKTPVSVLKAQLELALREGDPSGRRESLGAAQEGVERMSRVVSQLLSLARNEPEATRPVELAPLDLNALAFEAASAWVPVALKRRIDLGFEGEARPVMARGDAARLRELLDNLIDNAVRYGREGGRVTVRVSGGAMPLLQVEDDGTPIPREERARVFERFHRALGSTQGGSGLGLAIAREIARIHGATLELEPADGPGNVFSLTFPAD